MSFRESRQKAGLTQTKVAEIMGVSCGAVSQWENGLTQPRAKDLPKLAALYGTTIDELLAPEA